MPSVALAYVHSSAVSHAWHASMAAFWRYDLKREGHVYGKGCELAVELGTAVGLPGARNQAVREFLDVPFLEWLWWVDTDMGFAPDALYRLLQVAEASERPVMGGLCFALRPAGSDGMGGRHFVPIPTIYDQVGSQYRSRIGYERDAVQRCDATGSAMVVIHRSVLERMRPGSWYDRIPAGAELGLLGEDLSFCQRCSALGIPVHVHSGVQTTHHKEFHVGEAMFDAMRNGVPVGV